MARARQEPASMKPLDQMEAFARMQLHFTEADMHAACDEWGANCGPGAIAAICGLSLAELRPHLGDFEAKRYTNPTLMRSVLDALGLRYRMSCGNASRVLAWPLYGLARIQWEGPWTAPGANPRWGYRQTHWVAAMRIEGEDAPAIFDVNALNAGGWIRLKHWEELLVPWLLEQCVPRANGRWYITHSVEIAPPNGDELRARIASVQSRPTLQALIESSEGDQDKSANGKTPNSNRNR